MTQHPIKILPDGTRVYSNGSRYKPMADEDRKNKRRKPDDPRAVLYQGAWFLPLECITMESREMPETRPDTDAYDHAEKSRKCRCDVCRRPTARKWRAKWRADQRLLATTGKSLQ